MPLRAGRRPPLACPWLPELASGYLPQYRRVPQCRADQWGYGFQAQRGRSRAGIFVGFMTRPPGWPLGPFAPAFRPPECLVYAFVEPATGPLHRQLVGAPGSLFRLSYALLTKYTARRPRWEFYEEQGPALVRRLAVADFPRSRREKYALNFFMESLALVVRSGLPDSLARQLACRR